MVDFAVGGLGFKEDIACRLGAQVSQPFAHDVAVSITLRWVVIMHVLRQIQQSRQHRQCTWPRSLFCC